MLSRKQFLSFGVGVVCMWTGLAAAMPDEDAVFVGRAGEDIFVAVVSDGAQVLAYACDGTGDGVAIAAWMRGTVVGGGFSLQHPSGVTLTGRYEDGAVIGELALDGAAMAYTAAPAIGDAGLFEASTGEHRGGWIYDALGEARGAVIIRNTGDVGATDPPPPGTGSVVYQGTALTLAPVTSP